MGFGAFLPAHTKIGNNVFIGPNATMTDDRYPRVNNPQYEAAPPTIDDWACIGANATLLPGIHVGRGATVGAGAVVTRDVPPYAVAVGNPAKILRTHAAGEASSRIMLAESQARLDAVGFPHERD